MKNVFWNMQICYKNLDAECDSGFLCRNKQCEVGCRSDNSCIDNEACINNQCTNPCQTNECQTKHLSLM